MKKKIWPLMLVLVILTQILIGCGSKFADADNVVPGAATTSEVNANSSADKLVVAGITDPAKEKLVAVATTGTVKITALDKISKPEVVTVVNSGNTDVNMTGWKIDSVNMVHPDDPAFPIETYYFPEGFVLKAGAAIKIVSDKNAAPGEGILVWDTDSHWYNKDKNNALLYNNKGEKVLEFIDGTADAVVTSVAANAGSLKEQTSAKEQPSAKEQTSAKEKPAPAATPAPAETPAPAATPEPAATPAPAATPEPAETPAPAATPEPVATPEPAATPAPAASPAPAAAPGGIEITDIKKAAQPEVVIIVNNSGTDINMSGWRIDSVNLIHPDDPAFPIETFYFPEGFVLKAGATIQIVSDKKAVAGEGKLLWDTDSHWYNKDSNAAQLFNNNGEKVFELVR